MKYIAALIIAAGVYLTLAHKAPVNPAAGAAAAAQADDGSSQRDWLKEPLDRTHQVLGQAKTRANDPDLQ